VSAATAPDPRLGAPTARSRGLVRCHDCELLVERPTHPEEPAAHREARCPRCGAALHLRRRHSLSRSAALLLAASICYVPANLYPVMTLVNLGRSDPQTILGGALYLLLHGMWPLALIVFTASVVVPLAKIVVLAWLIVATRRGSRWRLRDRTFLYRVTEGIGRWSMVDIYVVTILVALVHLGNLATVDAGLGAVFFAAVVVLTMLAAEAYDPRLAWDAAEERA